LIGLERNSVHAKKGDHADEGDAFVAVDERVVLDKPESI
jgi:hypothetical protein